ncbi:MAG: stage 0 sporulation family protein [Chloroflexi bacterium]|nr:MAG: stage 0 sporulation family protein [Chloroflexota bacterium]
MISTSKHQPLVAGIRFQPTGKIYDFDAGGCPNLQPGDFALVETARGEQLGEVVDVRPLYEGEERKRLKPVVRRATGRDMAVRQQWQEKEKETLELARQTAARLGLPVKLVVAEYTFDGQRLTLLYATEKKTAQLDKLRQALQDELGIQVELRRIGPRDQAKLMGGYGACGELRCCSRFMSDFSPVSIKMAKVQGVSLNPADITGMCNRLRCCLVYEHEQYKEACKKMPRRKKRVKTPYGEGKVIDLLPLKEVVVVQVEDRRLEVPVEDIEVIST